MISEISIREFLWTIGIFLAINFVSALYQHQININRGLGWDGVEYFNYAKQMARHQGILGYAPKVWRLGTPFLAVHSGCEDLGTGFLATNIVANLLVVSLLPFWFAFWVKDRRIRILLSLIFQVNWVGPVRMVWFYPCIVDHWPVVFLLASLITMARYGQSIRSSWMVGALGFTGIFFKETLWIIPIAFLFLPASKPKGAGALIGQWILKFLPLILTAMGSWFLHHLVSLDPSFEPRNLSGRTVPFDYATEALDYFSRFRPGPWILAWFGAFGPILSVLFMSPIKVWLFLRANLFLLFVVLVLTILSIPGGADYERYFMLFSPVVFLLVGIVFVSGSVLKNKLFFVVLLSTTQIISQRMFWPTPGAIYDPAGEKPWVFLTFWGKDVGYTDLLAFYESNNVVFLRSIQYFVLAFLLIYSYSELFRSHWIGLKTWVVSKFPIRK